MTVNFHPVQTVKTNWNNASKAKKAAMVTGAAVATAAVAATVAAGVKGTANPDTKGIKKIASKIANGFSEGFKGLKSHLPNFKKANAENVADKATEAVAEAGERVAEAGEAVAAKATEATETLASDVIK